MVYVYAISSLIKNYIYVGMTKDVETRLVRHNKGREKTTKPYAPFRLIYTEVCANRVKARVREKYWKSGIGKQKLRDIRNQII
jgi:putative endonuclease